MSKVILITGASSGIGRITAKYLAEKGYVVYGTSRRDLEPEGNYQLLQLDVCDPESIKRAVAEIIQKEGRLDVLVNNAGMGITGPIEETPTEEMRRVFDTNFFGAIDMIKAVLPAMRVHGSGLIINITSIAGYMGLPFRGVYSATKGALELVGETLSMETRSFGVKVINVAPGDFATNIAAGRYHAPVIKDSPYETIYQKNLDLMNEHVDTGGNPMDMAVRIYELIETRKLKIHYRVGPFTQKLSILLKKILGDRRYERLLMRHYKM